MIDQLQDADDATLAKELAAAFEAPFDLSRVGDANTVFAFLSRFHWTAWENEPGDYVVLIRGRRLGFRGVFGCKDVVTGRDKSFARAGAIALIRKHRAERGT